MWLNHKNGIFILQKYADIYHDMFNLVIMCVRFMRQYYVIITYNDRLVTTTVYSNVIHSNNIICLRFKIYAKYSGDHSAYTYVVSTDVRNNVYFVQVR